MKRSPRPFTHLMFPSFFGGYFIEFINKEFNENEHVFYIVNMPYLKNPPNSIPEASNVHTVEGFAQHVKLIIHLLKAKTIFFHSLNHRVLIYLASIPGIAKKSHWLGWGADITRFKRKPSIKLKRRLKSYLPILDFFLFKRAVSKFKAFHNYRTTDFVLVKEQYGFKGRCYENFIYPSNTKWEAFASKTASHLPEKNLSVMVGHAVTPHIEHIDTFEKITPLFKRGLISEVLAPVSYGGPPAYKEQILSVGEKLFEDKFHSIEDFLPYDDFIKIIKDKVDVLIINGESLGGYGNMILALALRKILVLSSKNPLRESFTSRGIQVETLEEFIKDDYKLPSHEIIEGNLEKLHEYYSQKKLKGIWSNIFQEG
jgi:hypothetical protein